MRGLAVQRRQHITAARKQQAIGRRNHIGRPVRHAIETQDLAAGAFDGGFIVVRLAARRDGDDRHGYILAGTAIPIRSTARVS